MATKKNSENTEKKRRGPKGYQDPTKIRRSLAMRLNSHERELIEEAAASRGQLLTEWIRDTCLRVARRKRR